MRARYQRDQITASNRAARALWEAVWLLLYLPSPRPLHGWRRFLLRLFGAKVGAKARPYPSARIWAPWNLEMGEGSCLGDKVDCYSVAKVVLGDWSTVSQYSYLCSASHDYQFESMPLIVAPITIGARAWIGADAFIAPGVTIGEGAVVGARSTVFADVLAWTVVAGSPARHLKSRAMNAG